jgi:hypothetical protein
MAKTTSVFRSGPAHAAEMLHWHLSADPEDGTPTDIRVAAWAISHLAMSLAEEQQFLEALSLEKKPTPMGGQTIVRKS